MRKIATALLFAAGLIGGCFQADAATLFLYPQLDLPWVMDLPVKIEPSPQAFVLDWPTDIPLVIHVDNSLELHPRVLDHFFHPSDPHFILVGSMPGIISFVQLSTPLPGGLISVHSFSAGNAEITIAAVPEPSTWALMLLGFAGLGFVGYRRSLLRTA